MIALMATLKDKPDWSRKVFDEAIVAKWRSEALDFGKTMTAVESRSEEDGRTDNEDSGRRNGESIEFDGSDRQKLVSERMFDYVGITFLGTSFVLTGVVHCRASRSRWVLWRERNDGSN